MIVDVSNRLITKFADIEKTVVQWETRILIYFLHALVPFIFCFQIASPPFAAAGTICVARHVCRSRMRERNGFRQCAATMVWPSCKTAGVNPLFYTCSRSADAAYATVAALFRRPGGAAICPRFRVRALRNSSVLATVGTHQCFAISARVWDSAQ